LKKAAIQYNTIGNKIWHISNGRVQKEKQFIKDWDLLIKALSELKQDQTISDFLDAHFNDERFRDLKETTLQYVQGYNAAEPARASALALKEEWEAEDEAHQFRIEGGYRLLMNYFQNEVIRTGGTIFLSSVVTQIKWKRYEVEVITATNKSYYGKQALVTVPLGVLQAADGSEGSIIFSPALPEKSAAIQQMGFGTAIKIHIQCFCSFWEEKSLEHPMKHASFIFSDAFIPTWWTQHPNANGLLTGWLAGPKVNSLQDASDDYLFEKAIESLCYIFSMTKSDLLQQIKAYKIHNWTSQLFSRGAYSYATLYTMNAIEVLSKPEAETLFFAGEALFTGPMAGTVEVALNSGIETARKLIVTHLYD
jgi:monoamine oxidase